MAPLTPTAGRPRGRALPRVLPTLLVDRDGRLVKTVRFKNRTYIGDPINAVRIFNTKQVDELVLLDIDASADGREPPYERIREIAGEAFMPLSYGGGIRTVEQIASLYEVGVEKVVLSTALVDGLDVIGEAAARWGAQAVTVCLPYRRDWRGRTVIRVGGGGTKLKLGLHELLSHLGPAGAGEILLYSIDSDGTWSGFDLEELHRASQTTDLPLVACGGAGRIEDLASAVREGNASAVAAGSMFVYQAKGKGVLISYPDRSRLAEALRPNGEDR